MSVRKREQKYANGRSCIRWIVDIEFRHPDGRIERIRRTPRVQSRVTAEKVEREILSKLEQGQALRPELPSAIPSLATFWVTYYEMHVVVNNKPSEQASKQKILQGHLLPRFGNLRLNEISVQKIEVYKATMLKLGYAPKTVNNHLTVLRSLLKTAVRWDAVSAVAEVRLLRNVPPDVVYLDFEEGDRLVKAADAMWRPMIVLALNTGLRVGELIALHWEDVDLAKGRLRVTRNDWQGTLGTPKSGRNRDMPLNKAARLALDSISSGRNARVFTDEAGMPRTYRSCNYALESICKKAALKAVQWHALRHTFASHLVMKGVPLKAVQELLGHSTQAMTERYAHLTPDVRRTAVEVLDSGRDTVWAPNRKAP